MGGTIDEWNNWHLGAIPLVVMAELKPASSSYQKEHPIIGSNMVDLNGEAFKELKRVRGDWVKNDYYNNSGPVQFEGREASGPYKSLIVRGSEYLENLKSVEQLAEQIKSLCRFGTHSDILKASVLSLGTTAKIIESMKSNFKK